jgi:hypothetical protein
MDFGDLDFGERALVETLESVRERFNPQGGGGVGDIVWLKRERGGQPTYGLSARPKGGDRCR